MRSADYTFRLTDSESEAFKHELSHLEYDPNGHCQYINELRFVAMRTLPKRILTALVKQKASLSPRPYFVIENLPVDDEIYLVPKTTELSSDAKFKSGSISENLILAIASLVGEPYSIGFEGREIVNNLVTSQETRNDFTGLGSEVELDFHIENAALKCLNQKNYSPLGLFLTGVNYDPNGPHTYFSDGAEALRMLPKDVRDVLKQPRFKLKVPMRWRFALGSIASETDAVAVIQDDSEYPDLAVAFYADIIQPLDWQARLALQCFYENLKALAIGIKIQPGQLAYVDNRFALHCREAFKPTFDNEGRSVRWVQRVFVAANLWNHRGLVRERHRVFNPKASLSC